MDTLPTDIQNIIFDYKAQLEHTSKFIGCIKEIKEIEYNIEEDSIYITAMRDFIMYMFNKYTRRLSVE